MDNPGLVGEVVEKLSRNTLYLRPSLDDSGLAGEVEKKLSGNTLYLRPSMDNPGLVGEVVKKLSRNTLYLRPSLDDLGLVGEVEKSFPGIHCISDHLWAIQGWWVKWKKIIREYIVSPTIPGQSGVGG